MLIIMEGFEVGMRSRMLPEVIRVGSFTMFCSPKLLVISSSLLCLLAGLAFFREERYFFPSVGRNMGKKGRNTFLPGRNWE